MAEDKIEGTGVVRPEEYVAETNGGQQPEVEEKKEKTLEEQVTIYAEMFGEDPAKILEMAKSHQAEMSEEDRKTFTMMIFKPEGMTTEKAWKMVASEFPTCEYASPENITTYDENGEKINSLEADVSFARYNQEADEDTVNVYQSPMIKENIQKTWMTPVQGFIARLFYHRATGKQMDAVYRTQFPRTRTVNGEVPDIGLLREVVFDSHKKNYLYPTFGAREVK